MSKLFMNEAQISELLKRAYTTSVRDYALFHVALATGFRASDLLNLKRWDVAPQGKVVPSVKIKMQKTGKMVERSLPPTCQQALGSYLLVRADSNPFLFCSMSNNAQDRETPLTRFGLHKLVKRYLEILYPSDRLRGNACHVTRRSMAKLISDKAGRIEPASRYLGHVSIANTVFYLDMDGYSKQADDIVGVMLDKNFMPC